MCFERGKIITAVVAWVKRQLNAVAVSTDLKLMFAEEEGYGYELITETTTTTTKKLLDSWMENSHDNVKIIAKLHTDSILLISLFTTLVYG